MVRASLPPHAQASAASAPDHTRPDMARLRLGVDRQIREAPPQVLATAGAGKDPFQAQPPPARRVRDPEIGAADPDLETVGALLEGSRLYVLSAAYVAGHAAAPVLIAVRGLGYLHAVSAMALQRRMMRTSTAAGVTSAAPWLDSRLAPSACVRLRST